MEKAKKTGVISAVILSYNRCKEVLVTIDMLKELRKDLPYDLQIIVVDNASVDDTSAAVPGAHPDITFIRKETNNGIAGWNEGFKAVTTSYILVLDDDSCIVSGLTEAIEYLDNHLDAGILALNIVDQNFRGDPNLKDGEGWQHLERIAGFIGCGAIIRTALYRQIGGFAEWIYLYTHEFEYAMRCLQAGFNITFFQKSNVVHRVSSINRSGKRLRLYSTRNEMAIVYKYFGVQRSKYLARVFLNNLKFIKRDGMIAAYYVILGAMDFLKLKKTLSPTPVRIEVQNFYAENFWSTKQVLRSKQLKND